MSSSWITPGCEEIRGTYGLADSVIAETKAVFNKSPRRKRLFCQLAPGIPLPPKPIVTRWGEWLKAASYYSEHFEEVQAVIEQLELDAAVIEHAQELWETPNLHREFEFIHEHYSLITKQLRDWNDEECRLATLLISSPKLLQLFIETQSFLQTLKKKIPNVFLNNTGFSIDLLNICRSLQGEPNQNFLNGWNNADIQCMRYAPTTSCELERSFSSFKNILRSNRQTLTNENLEKFVVVYFNQLEFVEEPV